MRYSLVHILIFPGGTAVQGHWLRLGGYCGVPLRLQEEFLLPGDEYQAPGESLYFQIWIPVPRHVILNIYTYNIGTASEANLGPNL